MGIEAMMRISCLPGPADIEKYGLKLSGGKEG
jgi:hypothetical protein